MWEGLGREKKVKADKELTITKTIQFGAHIGLDV
jgi:hypothetical protein